MTDETIARTSNQQALEQQLLEAIDRLHPGTDCDNLRLRDAIVCLINASRRPADETTATPGAIVRGEALDSVKAEASRPRELPPEPFMYSTSYCEKHRNMPWSMMIKASPWPPRVVCPICEPPPCNK